MIDVSEYQGAVDWAKVYGAGVRRAYIKLLQQRVDYQAGNNLRAARAAGLEVGVYFYAEPSESPTSAARRFLRAATGTLHAGDLPPALDLEQTDGHGWSYLNDWKAQWFAAVDAAVGCRAAFYSYFSFWKQMTLYPDRPVWGAFLGTPTPDQQRLIDTWAIRQYSFTGQVSGIRGYVDLDRVLHDVPRIP